MKIALITQLTENDELLSHMAIHVWHLTKWSGNNAKTIFRSWGSHKCLCKKGVTYTWLTPKVMLLSRKNFSSISSYQSPPRKAYSTNMYITSISTRCKIITVKRAGWTTSVLGYLLMLFLMHGIIINHVLQVESIIRLGQDIILTAAFFLLKFCMKTWTWYENRRFKDSRSSEHWQELASRTNNALRLWVESWKFFGENYWLFLSAMDK
jgi:hypothetical protein